MHTGAAAVWGSGAAQPAGAELPDLPTALLVRVLQHLPPNELACTARLVGKDAAQHFSAPQHRTARLSLPLPPHAAGLLRYWQCELPRLPFHRKLMALSAAASSGCQTNLEVAWELVRPGLTWDVPEVRELVLRKYREDGLGPEPGTAAARAGHAHLLPWLLEHRLPLHPAYTLEAAAQYGDLAALQRAWEALAGHPDWDARDVGKVLALSRTPDAHDKVEWVLGRADCPEQFRRDLMRGAASEGNLERMQWLAARCGPPNGDALGAALAHHTAGVDAVRWLEQQGAGSWRDVWDATHIASYNKLEWVAAHAGVAVPPECWEVAGHHAAHCGDLPLVQHLHAARGVRLSERLWQAAVASGSIPLLEWLHSKGCPAGSLSYRIASGRGDADVIEWLVRSARVAPHPYALRGVINSWPYCTRRQAAPGAGAPEPAAPPRPGSTGAWEVDTAPDLLRVVRLLHGAGAVVQRSDALDAAAQRGDLPLVQLLRSLGATWSDCTVAQAAAGGCEAMLLWLRDSGYHMAAREGVPDPWADEVPWTVGDASTLRALVRLGVRCDPDWLQYQKRARPAIADELVALQAGAGG